MSNEIASEISKLSLNKDDILVVKTDDIEGMSNVLKGLTDIGYKNLVIVVDKDTDIFTLPKEELLKALI